MQNTYILVIVGSIIVGGAWLFFNQTPVEPDIVQPPEGEMNDQNDMPDEQNPSSTEGSEPDSPELLPDASITPPVQPLEQSDMHSEIIGMTEADAQLYAEAAGVPFRVTKRDGEDLMVTMDYVPGRINAVVEDQIVIDFTIE